MKYTLILLFSSYGILVGDYKDHEACDAAGKAATKTKEIEFVCLPRDQKDATQKASKPKKIPTPTPKPPATAKNPQP